MNTADMKVWKDIYTQLNSDIHNNEELINEIKKQIALQQERNKKEVEKLSQTVRAQQKELEDLLAQLEDENLFALDSDKEALNAFESTLKQRIEQSHQVLDFADSLLESSPVTEETIEKIEETTKTTPAPVTPENNPAPAFEQAEEIVEEEDPAAAFNAEYLLGNWIHYFTKDMFTCQSFWEDGEFKEYDFRGGQIIEERGGHYVVEDGKVIFNYENGEKAVYTVTGFSDDFIDYMISNTPIRFDYFPEELLNQLLDGTSHA